MAEPTSRLTVYDLVLEVAKAAEIGYYGTTGNEAAMIPIDEHDLDRCLRAVNDALRDFISKAPPNGWHWRRRLMEVGLVQGYEGTATAGTSTSLTDSDIAGDYDDDYFNTYEIRITAGTGVDEYATVTDFTGATGVFAFSGGLSGGSTPDTTSEYRICRSTQVIESDPTRYLLSEDFQGEIAGDISFVRDSNACGVEWTNEGDIRHRREVSVSAGDAPFVAAVLPASTDRRWELIIDPEPTSSKTIVFPYLANFAKASLVAGTASAGGTTSLTDSSIAGMYPNDYFNDKTIKILSGTGRTSYATVTDYTGSTGAFTVADWLYQNGAAGGTDPDATSVYYVDESAVPPSPMLFDFALVSACLAQCEKEFTGVKGNFTDKYLSIDLPSAWAIDGRLAPKKLGVMRSASGPRQTFVNRSDVVYSTE